MIQLNWKDIKSIYHELNRDYHFKIWDGLLVEKMRVLNTRLVHIPDRDYIK